MRRVSKRAQELTTDDVGWLWAAIAGVLDRGHMLTADQRAEMDRLFWQLDSFVEKHTRGPGNPGASATLHAIHIAEELRKRHPTISQKTAVAAALGKGDAKAVARVLRAYSTWKKANHGRRERRPGFSGVRVETWSIRLREVDEAESRLSLYERKQIR